MFDGVLVIGQVKLTTPLRVRRTHQCLRQGLFTCNFHSLAFRLVSIDFKFSVSRGICCFSPRSVRFELAGAIKVEGMNFAMRQGREVLAKRKTNDGFLVAL